MEDGKYKVIREIHIYSCFFGHLAMGAGTVFEISDCGKKAESGSISFAPELLSNSGGCYVKI